jgi:hypothetical protein
MGLEVFSDVCNLGDKSSIGLPDVDCFAWGRAYQYLQPIAVFYILSALAALYLIVLQAVQGAHILAAFP